MQLPEVRAFYGFQIAIENIHGEMYSLLLQQYVKDRDELQHLLRGIHTIECVGKKANWAQRWIGSSQSFAERLVGAPQLSQYSVLTRNPNAVQGCANYACHQPCIQASCAHTEVVYELMTAELASYLAGGFCVCGGHPLQRQLCKHFLAEEERPHAWPHLLQ